MRFLWGIWTLSFFLFNQNEILHILSCLAFNIFLSFNPSKCLFIDLNAALFSMNVSFLANTELNLSSLVSEEGELISFRAKVRENRCIAPFVVMFSKKNFFTDS